VYQATSELSASPPIYPGEERVVDHLHEPDDADHNERRRKVGGKEVVR
jgi:hypothetical protein